MPPDSNKPPFWVPNINVLVNAAGELVIEAELAGVARKEIKITIDGQRLTLTGQRADPDSDAAQRLVIEVHHGRFESVVEVPEAFDLSCVKTTHQNGMLRIVAPRRKAVA
jgi:HSP20 family protein